MGLKLIWVPSILIISLFLSVNSEEQVVKQALVKFMEKLAPNNAQRDSKNWGWNLTSDPCTDHWHGVICHSDNKTVMSIVLEHLNLKGVLDATSLSTAKSLMLLSLKNNALHDSVSEDIGNLKSLTHLYLNGNRFSGKLPISIGKITSLMRLHVSDNNFSGEIPEMSRLSQLVSFLADNNNFTGRVPHFDFSKLQLFNVSNNKLYGPIPDVRGKFFQDSFYGNPGLCGKPLANACPPAPAPAPAAPLPLPLPRPPPNSSHDGFKLYLGYIVLCFMVLAYIVLKLVRKFKTKDRALDEMQKTEKDKPNSEAYYNSSGSKSGIITGMRSESSFSSLESGMASASGLVVLSSAEYKALRFEDLLGAPAELVRRGKNGSLYKVMMENGMVLAVKRVKDCGISKQHFQTRMEIIAKVKHPRVLPPLAYYCSHQEKLLVYEYMHNGSLFMLLYGSQSGGHHSFGWRSRLKVAVDVAGALAHMHENLRESEVASHGNLKSSNILFDNNIDPFISEYGLFVTENNNQHYYYGVKGDIYAFGVILLEMLTGKVVKNSDGFGDLAKWVNSVVREEWTVEVFDKSLIREGASEERMMSLLQVALNCTSASPNDRPSMNQVAMVIRSLKEDEEKSVSF
ncbi:probable inactive receptor kinase At2g26730 [Arachis stenosperma]|uniref:probable inactive receptor kinase At2g26730 n=1 Tax=Arachis stenosperma TaxID=217475 RepID=UPI0025AD7196|nr:probable inactive receptor kinase At2g26730 [Arachis stenosperma]